VMGTAQVDAALVLVESFHPDVVVWNCDESRMDDTAKRVRSLTEAYIIGLTRSSTPERRIAMLNAGADAVLMIPCTAGEVAAQVGAVMRRPRTVSTAPSPVTQRRRFGPLDLDTGRRDVVLNGVTVPLTRIEFDVLTHLCNHPAEVVSREELVVTIWGPDWDGDTHMVDVHISNMRRKFERIDASAYIVQTVRGVGFRLAPGLFETF